MPSPFGAWLGGGVGSAPGNAGTTFSRGPTIEVPVRRRATWRDVVVNHLLEAVQPKAAASQAPATYRSSCRSLSPWPDRLVLLGRPSLVPIAWFRGRLLADDGVAGRSLCHLHATHIPAPAQCILRDQAISSRGTAERPRDCHRRSTDHRAGQASTESHFLLRFHRHCSCGGVDSNG